MKKLFGFFSSLTFGKKTKKKDNGDKLDRPGRAEYYTNAETTPSRLFDQYRKVLKSPGEVLED